MRLAQRFEALDFIRLRHGDRAYVDQIMDELLFAPPIFSDAEASLANYDFTSGIRKLKIIAEYGYLVGDRIESEHAVTFNENLYKEALE